MADEPMSMVPGATPSGGSSPATLRRAASRIRHIPLMPTLPIGVLAVFILTAILASFLNPYDPIKGELINSLIPPAWVPGGSMAHVLGTDGQGRDVLARLMYGARVSFSVAGVSLLIALTIGTTVGVVAGYRGGWVDSLLMRTVDVVLSVPPILVALVIAVAVGASFIELVIVLGALIWPRIARLIRAEALVLRKQDFVRYADAIGVPGWVIMIRHIVPNVLATLLVMVTLEIGSVILLEAALSFLGAGIPPPAPSWGTMIADSRALIATGWWIALFPGLAITATVLSCNALGDWLRDYLDPKTRQM